MILENNGIITDDNYYQDREYITSSMVKASLQGSKKKFDHIMGEREPTESMLVGSAFHAMMLEPDKYHELFAFDPNMDRRTKAGKEYIAEWKEENKDVPHHLPGKYEEMLLNMKESLECHPKYKELINDPRKGEREVIKLFELEGEKCKAKVDYYDPKNNFILDIKTCSSVNLDDIVESIKKYAYGVQAAFYLDGLKAHKFYFAFIEKKAPYDVVIVDFVSGLENSRNAYKAGIKNIKAFRNLDTLNKVDGVNYYSMFNKIVTM